MWRRWDDLCRAQLAGAVFIWGRWHSADDNVYRMELAGPVMEDAKAFVLLQIFSKLPSTQKPQQVGNVSFNVVYLGNSFPLLC